LRARLSFLGAGLERVPKTCDVQSSGRLQGSLDSGPLAHTKHIQCPPGEAESALRLLAAGRNAQSISGAGH